MVNLTIDGKAISVPKGTTILEAARKLDIHIPTLCWLEKVSTTGACRICAVEIEGVERPMTACNTPVKEGINVTTQSERLTRTRKQIMELILVNHPLDCPVCDAGGECELQNTCYNLDVTRQEFTAEDVNPDTIDHWPLIQQVPSRCILCEKCVKVCHEIVGSDALFVNAKGDRAFIDKKLESCTFCGNCVSVCPTGTMISKPFKFKARPWQLKKTPSICHYCGSQCQIDIHTLDNKVARITSDDNGTINNGNLCVGGFFSYGFVNNQQRLKEPVVEEKPVSWDTALDTAVAEIKRIVKESGGDAVAGLASPRLTNEENYLFQKLFRVGIGSNNIDSEARFGAMRALRALDKGLGLQGASNKLSAIAEADAILVIGADPSSEAPAIEWQIRKAASLNNAKLVVANMRKIHLDDLANSQLVYKPGSEIGVVKGLISLLLADGYLPLDTLEPQVSNFAELKADIKTIDLKKMTTQTGLSVEQLREAAAILGRAEKVAIIFGGDVTRSAFGLSKVGIIANLAMLTGALRSGGGLYPIDEKGNVQGTLDMGVYPEALPGYQDYHTAGERFAKAWQTTLPEGGLDAEGILQEIEAGKIRCLYLAAVNPMSFPNSNRWLKALEKVQVLITQDVFPSAVTRLAKVVLPATTYAEKTGSYTSLDHRVASLGKALNNMADSRSDWDILSAVYQRLTGEEKAVTMQAVDTEIGQLTELYTDAQTCGGTQRPYRQKALYQIPAEGLKYQLITGGDEVEGLQLLTGASSAHFGTTSTWAGASLEIESECQLQINPLDADKVGVTSGDMVKLTSSSGTVVVKTLVTDAVQAGLLFAPYNFLDCNVQGVLADGSNRATVDIVKV